MFENLTERLSKTLRHITGHTSLFRPYIQAILQDEIQKRQGVRTLLRGIIQQQHDGSTTVTPAGPQGSGILRSMSLANCLIDIPEEVHALQPGDPVRIMQL